MSDNRKESLFPQEKMEILMDGFEGLKKDYKHGEFEFLSAAVRDGELISQDLILAAAPLRFPQLLFRSIQIAPLYKQFRRSWFKSLLSKNERAEDWPWAFALAAQYCAFGNPPQILKAFNMLCKRLHYSGQLCQISDLALKKMEILKDDVLTMDPNSFYFDFTSPQRKVILPPLSSDEIATYSQIADTLRDNQLRWYSAKSEEEALKVIRFYQCAQNGHIMGYEDVNADSATALMRKCLYLFKMTSSYLIVQKFMALCYEGKGASAVGLFLEYKDVLSRPMRYRTIFRHRRGSIRNYIDFISQTPSRLADGIGWSLRRGHREVLFEFLSEPSTRGIVNSKRFVYDLSEMLGSRATEIAINVYRQCIGKHVDILLDRLAELRRKEIRVDPIEEDYSIRFSEDLLIRKELDDWDRYYDDRNLILRVLSSKEPEHLEAHKWIMALGYCHDLTSAKVAVQTKKESYQLLDQKLQKHPEILKLIEENT